MEFTVRRARHEDAAQIINSHRRSIREICSRDYSTVQIAAWSGRDFQETRWHQTIDRDFVWVIEDSNKAVLGFGHLQVTEGSAHLAGLYFAPEATGHGLGREIVQSMVAICRERSVKKVTLTATKTARSFYETVGFKQVGESKEEQIGGVALSVFEMLMEL